MSIASIEALEQLSEKYRFTIGDTWSFGEHEGDDTTYIDIEFDNVTRAVLFHNAFCQVVNMEFLDGPIDFHEKVRVTVWDGTSDRSTQDKGSKDIANRRASLY